MPLRSDSENFALIRVIGVGGGGSNAVNRMIRAEMMGVEFIAVNTDAQALLQSDAPHKIRIGDKITRGLGAGGDPASASARPRRTPEKIYEALKDSDMVFITAGMGGGTGSGAAPVIAEIARDLGALTIGVVTKPFSLRGRQAPRLNAEKAIEALRDKVDTLITIPNDRLKDVVQKDDLDRRGLPRRGRRAAPGRPGHQRPDHRARPDQPRLRRRARDHEGRRLGAHGHRPRQRREPRRRGGPRGHRQPAARGQHRGRPGRAVQHHRRPDLGLFEVDEAAEIIKRDGRPGGQHHLRHGHRRAHGRRGRRSRSSPPASTPRASARSRRRSGRPSTVASALRAPAATYRGAALRASCEPERSTEPGRPSMRAGREAPQRRAAAASGRAARGPRTRSRTWTSRLSCAAASPDRSGLTRAGGAGPDHRRRLRSAHGPPSSSASRPRAHAPGATPRR